MGIICPHWTRPKSRTFFITSVLKKEKGRLTAALSSDPAKSTLEAGDPLRGLRRIVFLKKFGEEEGELQRLGGIEPRVAMRVVAVAEILGEDRPRTAGAFGDILAGHLDMDAAG